MNPPASSDTAARRWRLLWSSMPVALAYLAWFVYAPQCLSTIAVVRRETNSLPATAFFTGYLFVLAYFAAWVVYRLALLWG